ncbi:MAG: hypothetical protein M0017_00925 [Desulfobacteraceae bacterium]|nr:hypothetical protein [Desulfobacteraceae bacterium]
MVKPNCWQVLACGREPGGAKTGALGVCPAAIETRADGLHGGENGGRACWAISATLCHGRPQGTYTQKAHDCLRCKFLARVRREERRGLLSLAEIRQHLKINCWEHLACGRELGGVKAGELGVCPAAIEAATDGLHGGQNGGRVCWAVSGTLCGGRVQTTFARKAGDCLRCEFFERVRQEEPRLISVAEIQALL